MKYFKISICSLAAFASLSCIQATEYENSKIWTELRGKLQDLSAGELAKSTVKAADEERRAKIDGGFLEIEKEMDFRLPESLKEFHRNVGSLVFAPLFFPTPIGGVESPLYELIMKGKKKLSNEWVFFGEIDANEYFAINYSTQEVSRFTVIPRVQKCDSYSTVTAWLRKVYLTY